MEVKLRSKLSHWPEIPRRYAFYFLNKTLTSNPLCWGEHQQISGAAALANILFVVHTFHFTICSVVFFKASQRFQTSNSGINSMHNYVLKWLEISAKVRRGPDSCMYGKKLRNTNISCQNFVKKRWRKMVWNKILIVFTASKNFVGWDIYEKYLKRKTNAVEMSSFCHVSD